MTNSISFPLLQRTLVEKSPIRPLQQTLHVGSPHIVHVVQFKREQSLRALEGIGKPMPETHCGHKLNVIEWRVGEKSRIMARGS